MCLILTLLSIIQLTCAWPQYHYQEQQQKQQHSYEQSHHNQHIGHYYTELNKCHDIETGRQLFIGDFFTRPGQCVRVQCLGTLQIWEDRCQIPKLNDNNGERNCSSLPIANEFLDYPRCCPLYECHSFHVNRNSEIDTRQIYDHMGNLVREHITQRILIVLDRQSIDNDEPMRPVDALKSHSQSHSQFHINQSA